MYSTRRRTGSRWLMVFVFGLFVLTGLAIFLTLSSEAVGRRIEAVPYYARTYLNKLRPNVAMPAPPAESAIADMIFNVGYTLVCYVLLSYKSEFVQ